jgi:putative ABC transport system permease protein
MPLFTELRLGFRTLTRTPGFFLLALLTLALGIGATAALFSVTESVLWRPLPFPDSERLALLSEHNAKSRAGGRPASAANFLDWRDRARSFQRLGAVSYDGENHTLTGTGERARSLAVSAGFFETLGVQPALGRTFRREEESAHAQLALLTDDFWRAHFGGAADVVGRTFQLDRQPYTIVGVLPADFHLESVMYSPDDVPDPQLFVPLDVTGARSQRGNRELGVIARVKRDVSLAAAAAEMDSLSQRLAAEHPQDDAGWDVRIENLRQSFTRYNRAVLYLFLGFAVFVLLIACANVAGLQLVRAAGRQREYALRVALGARRTALLRQALAETAWIALPGGAAGALLADWGLAGLRALMPPGSLARAGHISMDLPALALVLAVSLSITLLVAMAPVLLMRKMDLDAALREGSKSVAATPRTQRRLNALIAAEIALSFVLLFGAGLFIGSHSRLKQVALGFDPHDVLTVRITAGGAQRSSPNDRRPFYREVMRRAADTGGIRQVALASDMPLAGGEWIPYTVAGHPLPARGAEPESLVRIVSPGYFEVLRIPLQAGRAFTELDSELAPRVAMVNENLVRGAFAGENPIGKVLAILPGGDSSIPVGPVEIVGVVSNSRELGLNEVAFEDIYLPFAQNPQRTMSLAAKTGGPAAGIAASLRKELQNLDPDSALYNPRTLEDMLAQQFRGERFHLMLVSIFAALAALLAGVGIYGAIAFSVAQRTREFGLRMALGAMPAAIRRLTLARTTRLALTGVACGLGVSLILGQLLRSALYLVPHQHSGLIYGVGIRDPLSLLAAAAIVLGLAAMASLAPAGRAARVEPSAALRDE